MYKVFTESTTRISSSNHFFPSFLFFFLFFLDEISIKTRLHYLIWWRGKLFQDKLPIRFRLARCCFPLGRHFWSTPSRYRCFYTRLCKISERKFSRVRRIWPIIKIPRFLSIDFYLSIENRIGKLGRTGHFGVIISSRNYPQKRIGLNWRVYLVGIAHRFRLPFSINTALSLNFNWCTYLYCLTFSGNKQNCFITRPFIIYVWSTRVAVIWSLFHRSSICSYVPTRKLWTLCIESFFWYRRKR